MTNSDDEVEEWNSVNKPPKEIIINLSNPKVRPNFRDVSDIQQAHENKKLANENAQYNAANQNRQSTYDNHFINHNTQIRNNFNQQKPNPNIRNGERTYYNRMHHNNESHLQFNQLKFCDICKRFGHLEEYCRVKLRACFICGSPQHFIKDCPRNYNNKMFINRDSIQNQRPNFNQYKSVSPSNRQVFSNNKN